MPFRLSQIAFRGRNDDGSESAATWKAAQDTNWAQLVDIPLRVRFRMDETGGTAWTNKTFNLRYSLNGGAYTAVAAGQPVVFAASGNFAQGADCTTQLTGGTGTFVTDNNGMCESGGAVNSGTGGFLFEVEFSIQLVGSSLNHGDTITLRVYDGTSAINAYTVTPSITASKPAALIATGIDAGVPALDTPILSQAHGLTATGIAAGSPALGTPILSENATAIALEAVGVDTGAPVLENPAVGQIHGLIGVEFSTGAAVMALPAVSQEHALTAAELAAGGAALGSPSVGQSHSLAGIDLASAAPTLESPTVGQVHNLTAIELSCAASDLQNPNVGQVHNLSGDAIAAGTPAFGTPALSENTGGVDALQADGIACANPLLDSPEITQLHVLVIAALLYGGPTLDQPTMQQVHNLTANALTAGDPIFGHPGSGGAGGNRLKSGLFRGIHKGLEKEITIP